MQLFNIFSVLFGIFITSVILFVSLYDQSYCFLEGSSIDSYFQGKKGYYIQIQTNKQSSPDFFQLFELKHTYGDTAIVYSSNTKQWLILKDKEILYFIPQSNSSSMPPQNGWIGLNDLIVTESSGVSLLCHGELTPRATSNQKESNIQMLLNHPIVILIISVLCYIAYHIWQFNLEQSTLTFSYAAVVDTKEYWRGITASVTHFEVLHLVFNTMALYQLMDLETVYNSVKYAYLSANLVVLTMLIFTGIFHVLIHRFNRPELAQQQAVGYSCVLFAWMVAASVRMNEFCPLNFIFPSFCFSTYVIPIGSVGFPINIGPILLLVITKFIIPRSSFTGHLAGIIIGFPLAWNLLNWLTPPILFALCVSGIVWFRELYLWKFPGFGATASSMSDLGTQVEMNVYYGLVASSVFVCFSCVLVIITNPIAQFLPRLVEVALVYMCWQTRRCFFFTDSRVTHDQGTELLFISAIFIFSMLVFDNWTLWTALCNVSFLDRYVESSTHEVIFSLCSIGLVLLSEIVFLGFMVASLQGHREALPLLAKCRLDWSTLQKDLQWARILPSRQAGLPSGGAFSGVGRRATNSDQHAVDMIETSQRSSDVSKRTIEVSPSRAVASVVKSSTGAGAGLRGAGLIFNPLHGSTSSEYASLPLVDPDGDSESTPKAKSNGHHHIVKPNQESVTSKDIVNI